MLKDCIPLKIVNIKQIKELFDAEQPELDLFLENLDNWKKELYIFTADKTIEKWERDFSLLPDPGMTIEQRRARVFARKIEGMMPLKEELENKIQTIIGAKRVLIEEENCFFRIYVETSTLVGNMEIAEDFFRKVRPAHFGFEFINEIRRESTTEVFFAVCSVVNKEWIWEVET